MSIPDGIAWLERLQSLSRLSFTHDGKALLVTIAAASTERDKPHDSHVWRFGLDGSKTQLTRGPHAEGFAVASPVDDRIAFTSERTTKGKMDLFVIEGTGDPRPLGDVPGSIESAKWTPDGKALIVQCVDRGLNGGWATALARIWWGDDDDPAVRAPQRALRRLFRIDAATGATAEVGPHDLTVWEFDLMPDGNGAIAVCSADADERGWHHPKVMQIDFDRRSARLIHESPWQIQGVSVSPDGKRVALTEGWSSDRGLLAGEMRIVDIASRAVHELAGDELSNVTQLSWIDDESLWFCGWKNLGVTYGVIGADGVIAWQIDEDATVGEGATVASFVPSSDNKRLAAVRENIGEPQEIFVKDDPRGAWRKLSDINGEFIRSFPNYPEVRRMEWEGTDGLKLESFVFVPKNLGPGPHPTVVDVHGGPCMSAKYSFDPCGGLAWAVAGYVAFVPNYRGNVAWGQKVTKMNVGDPAGAEFDDILAGVDKCVELGLADPDRLGVTGASYGGYLSCWAVAASDRFKAAIPISCISNQMSSHYACDHDFHEFINGGSLREEKYRQIAIERSPINRLDKPTTATLLIQGKEDRCCPVGQAQEFYSALKERNTPVELVVYPREGHWLLERGHKEDAWERKLSWFDRYLRQVNV